MEAVTLGGVLWRSQILRLFLSGDQMSVGCIAEAVTLGGVLRRSQILRLLLYVNVRRSSVAFTGVFS